MCRPFAWVGVRPNSASLLLRSTLQPDPTRNKAKQPRVANSGKRYRADRRSVDRNANRRSADRREQRIIRTSYDNRTKAAARAGVISGELLRGIDRGRH